MKINDDQSRSAAVHGGTLDWIPSPASGVERRMLFRTGGERAHATSLVRYAPGSSFPSHAHPGGEEFLVLEGTFQDERGDYPVGTYVRNPPGSRHAPASAEGCVIFVRLRQFRDDDDVDLVRSPGGTTPLLFANANERVSMRRWSANETLFFPNTRGLELLVVSGTLAVEGSMCEAWTWLRLPAGIALRGTTGAKGAQLWWKDGPPVLSNEASHRHH